MEERYLFENEQFIASSDQGILTLTTHRIRCEFKSWGYASTTSIMLEKISSIDVRYTNPWFLLLIGAALLVATMFNQFLALAGFMCIVDYFIARKQVITVSSDGGSQINIEMKEVSKHAVLELVNKIEQAKSNAAHK